MTSPNTGSAAQPTSFSPAAEGPRGRFLWYDLMTTDIDAAIAFYGAVTGWTTNVWQTEGMPPYTMWVNAAGQPIGGVMGLPAEEAAQGIPPHWLAYIGTPDCDATAAEATALGGTVLLAPRDIPTVGRFAVLADPQGAAFAIFTPQSPDQPEKETPGFGDISWHELITTDREAAFAFYSRLFGWTEQSRMDMGEMGIYQMYGRGALTYGGMMNRPNEQIPPNFGLYVRVANLDAAVAATKAKGGQVLNGPMEVPGGDTIANCMDPQGGMFSLHQKKC